MQGQRTPGPALKRPPRRAPKWVQRAGAELTSQRVDDAHRPAVEWIGEAITIFRAVRKRPPLLSSSEADQDQCAHGIPGNACETVARLRVQSAACNEPDRADAAFQFLVARRQKHHPAAACGAASPNAAGPIDSRPSAAFPGMRGFVSSTDLARQSAGARRYLDASRSLYTLSVQIILRHAAGRLGSRAIRPLDPRGRRHACGIRHPMVMHAGPSVRASRHESRDCNTNHKFT